MTFALACPSRRETTTWPALERRSPRGQLASGFRLPSLGMAKRMIDAADGEISFHSIIATWEEKNGPLA